MNRPRRVFLEQLGALTAAAAIPEAAGAESQHAKIAAAKHKERFGVLVDISTCIGCRKCEFACQEAAGFKPPPIEKFDDGSVFDSHRRPLPRAYTTVNRFSNAQEPAKPVYVKVNCLHCNEPACASACLVGALRKQPNGAVTYDATKCMGCRYCMVACPFQIPAYDYDDPLTPQVRKCTFCFDRISRDGEVPACVKICPRECLTFGKRAELLALAHERIRQYPDRYENHVYGELECGGTSWLYISPLPFDQLGMLQLPFTAPSSTTEAIQHGIFRGGFPPLALYGLLGLIMWLGRRGKNSARCLAEGECIPMTAQQAHHCGDST